MSDLILGMMLALICTMGLWLGIVVLNAGINRVLKFRRSEQIVVCIIFIYFTTFFLLALTV